MRTQASILTFTLIFNIILRKITQFFSTKNLKKTSEYEEILIFTFFV